MFFLRVIFFVISIMCAVSSNCWDEYSFNALAPDIERQEHYSLKLLEPHFMHMHTVLDLMRAIYTTDQDKLQFVNGLLPSLLAISFYVQSVYERHLPVMQEDLISSCHMLCYIKSTFKNVTDGLHHSSLVCMDVLFDFIEARLYALYFQWHNENSAPTIVP